MQPCARVSARLRRWFWPSDGARGLWRRYEERWAAYAVGILDFSHAAQSLWKGAAAWRDGRTTQARRWCGWARHRLRHGQPDGVVADGGSRPWRSRACLPLHGRR